MRPLKIKRSITLDEDVARQINDLAEEQLRSFSQQVNLILRQYFRQKEKETREEKEKNQ